MSVYLWLAAYMLAINVVGFFSMYLDKRKARKKLWRIPEATLFLIAIIGGSIGSLIGMHVFRHKTRHWYFVFGIPFILFLQVAAVIVLLHRPLRLERSEQENSTAGSCAREQRSGNLWRKRGVAGTLAERKCIG